MSYDTFDPWWGDLCLREAEAERAARAEDKREAEEFAGKYDEGYVPKTGDSPEVFEAYRKRMGYDQ